MDSIESVWDKLSNKYKKKAKNAVANETDSDVLQQFIDGCGYLKSKNKLTKEYILKTNVSDSSKSIDDEYYEYMTSEIIVRHMEYKLKGETPPRIIRRRGFTSNKEVVKPSNKEVVKPSNKEVVKPSNKEVVKPSKKEVVKPSKKEVVKPSKKEVEKPSNKEVEKPSKKEPEVDLEKIWSFIDSYKKGTTKEFKLKMTNEYVYDTVPKKILWGDL